jgi:hypothetical protein
VVSVAIVIEPLVADVARPEVDHLSAGKQGHVERVIGMMVGEEHMRDGLGRHAQVAQRVEDP